MNLKLTRMTTLTPFSKEFSRVRAGTFLQDKYFPHVRKESKELNVMTVIKVIELRIVSHRVSN